MKNILIPTTLQSDTVTAVKWAIKQAGCNQSTITLMLLNSVCDSESAACLLRNTKTITRSETEVLDKCRQAIKLNLNCKIEIHTQFGLSAPLLKNLLQHLRTNLIILPASYSQQRELLYHNCLANMANNEIPILHLTEKCTAGHMGNALYVEHSETKLCLEKLQKFVIAQFDFKIVSHASVDDKNPEVIDLLIAEAVSKDSVDLIIETRKHEKRRKKQKQFAVNNTLTLPVLSLFEKAIT